MGFFDSLANLDQDQNQGLLAAAAQMLQQSGPSRLPVGLGQILGAGLNAYAGGLDAAKKRKQEEEQAAQMAQLRGLNIQQLQGDMSLQQAARARQQQIQSELMRQNGPQPGASMPSTAAAPEMASAAPGGPMSPKIAGPDWMQAYQAQQPAAAPAQPTPTAPRIGGAQNSTEAYANRLLNEAEVYSKYGDFAGADQRYQAAAKLLPQVDKIETAMQNGQPVRVITFKDGSEKVSSFDAKPDFQQVDLGGKKVVQDFNRVQNGQTFTKTATPGEMMSNAQSGARLAFDRQQAARPVYNQDAGGFISPPSAAAPGGMLTPLDGYTKPEKPLTESQGKATLFTSRMSKADQIMGGLSAAGTNNPSAIKSSLESIPLIGGGLSTIGNFAASAPQQQLEQAQRDFLNAVLRQESGAAISPSEFESGQKQYFPQRGDAPEVLAQKAANRQTAIQGMAIQAGPGAAKVNVSTEAPAQPKRKSALKGQVLDGYRFKGGDPADQNSWEKI